MCMYGRAERSVSQRPVSNRRARPARIVQERQRREVRESNAVATCWNDPFAFLNVKLKDKPVKEEQLSSCYNLNIASSYDRLCRTVERFMRFFGKPFDFAPKKRSNIVEKLDGLISWFEPKVEELGFQLATLKHDPYDEDCADIDFVVYSPCAELEMKVIVFIASPAETLPPKAAELYKEFISFVSDSMCIYIGANSDNYYLDMIMTYHDDPDQDIEELEGEDREHLQKRRDTVAAYREGGKYEKLFEEIRRLHPENLKERMEQYIEECDDFDVCHLFKVIVDGLPVVKQMNIHWFDFNPDVDGFTEEGDGYIEVFSQQAILYSDNDGIEDALIQALENDYNCGVNPVDYNLHLWLSEELKDDEIREFAEAIDLGSRFSKWIVDFYHAVKKFDKIQEEEDEYI